MAEKKIVAVVGATGAQGGGLARAILSDAKSEFGVRALTREVNSEKAQALAKLGAEVVSVSTDTQFAHLAWRDSEKLLAKVSYLMGADPTGNVSRLLGVYDPNTGLALRGTFIISPQGKLVCSEINFYNVGRDMGELVRRLEANVYLMAHPAEACPAKWKQGAKTLKPSEKLVGKVYEALHG